MVGIVIALDDDDPDRPEVTDESVGAVDTPVIVCFVCG